MSTKKYTKPPLRRSASLTTANGRLLFANKTTTEEYRLVDVAAADNFSAVQGSTIQCRRNLASLLSDRQDRHVKDKLIHNQKIPKTSSEEETSSESEEDEEPDPPSLLLERKSSWQMPGKFDDKCAKQWNWPLPHQPKIQNQENRFEVELVIAPYSPEDIWVRAVGSDLVMRFAKPGDHELQRTYQLPINVDPKSINFALSKSARVLRISANKISPIKFMAAAYGSTHEKSTFDAALAQDRNLAQTLAKQVNGAKA